MSEQPLHRLAAQMGLARDWVDANNRPQQVSDDVLRQVLQGLGHPAHDRAAIDASLLAVAQAQDSEHLPPLITVDSGQPLDLQRYFSAGSTVRCTLEDGSQQTLQLDAQARLPGELPLGYHQLDIDGRSFTVAVAPCAAMPCKTAWSKHRPAAGAWRCSCTACVAPAMAATATAWPWSNWRATPPSAAPKPWRSARSTRCR